MGDLQAATHPRLHVRNSQDAHVVFEAVRLGYLRPVTRRLNEVERLLNIRSGSIFVWEEALGEAGLKRWTDGRVWSQSRMREPYLFYDERLPNTEGKYTHARQPPYRFVYGASQKPFSSSAMSHRERSEQHPGLVKQAYAAWVTTGPSQMRRRWHLTAYFTYADLPDLPTVDQDALLNKISVPRGVYCPGKIKPGDDSDGKKTGDTQPSFDRPTFEGPSQGYDNKYAQLQGESAMFQIGYRPRPGEDTRAIKLLDSALHL